MALLEIKNLRLDFVAEGRAARAVDGVSTRMEADETLCIAGESGCGKSVTAQSIAHATNAPRKSTKRGKVN
jgi:oligopeptide transport system ATP-binding protein